MATLLMLDILLVRHGNTFDKGDVVTRVGLKTDLPLSQSGQHQAIKLRNFLTKNHPKVHEVYCSELQRTYQTAQIAVQNTLPITPLALLNEIDYGVDENQPEECVITRIGEKALMLWDEKAIPPTGWQVDVEAIKKNIQTFTSELCQHKKNKTILLVTSNGIARFFPFLLVNVEKFRQENTIKLKTGAISHLKFDGKTWHVIYWGISP